MGTSSRTDTLSPGYTPGATIGFQYHDASGAVTKSQNYTLDANLTPK
jgi:hypothetical protein